MSVFKSQGRNLTAAKYVIAFSLLGGCAGALITRELSPSPGPIGVTTVHAAVEQAFPNGGFAPVVHRATPAVVNISSSKVIKVNQRDGAFGMGSNLPPGLREFFGMPGMDQQPRSRREQSLGSGVIVDPRGYILTNNHVVEGATTVKVSLSDRREIEAKVVGTDPQTDIAVLKVDAGNLPSLAMGDSSKVQVGDLALAIGNPFGIGQTVTMGIIGATGRSGLGIENYEDFIQTDAAINPGNSGGALIDTRGDLVAINTAILSGNSGGNQGIGFAIPINMAREVMDQLVKNGKVVRGYMGVQAQTVNPSIARSFRLPDATEGVVVASVEPKSPADKAGLQVGDVITAINNQPVADQNTFRLRVSRSEPGSTITAKVLRDGATKEVPVKLALFPKQPGDTEDQPETTPKSSPLQGVSVETLTPDIARQLHLPSRSAGVAVDSVDESSAAAAAGLREGDVIQSVNRKPVASVEEFERAVHQGGNSVLLLVSRGGRTLFMPIDSSLGK